MKIRNVLSLTFIAVFCGLYGCNSDSESNSECTIEDDCTGDSVCENGKCVAYSSDGKLDAACTENAECASGLICENNKCVQDPKATGNGNTCTSNANCMGGQICKNGHCVKGSSGGNDTPSPKPPENTTDNDMVDSDGDTIPNKWDSCTEDTDGDGLVNCLDSDSDNDTIPDSIESYNEGIFTNEPLSTNPDGIYNFLTTDSDGNGISDTIEAGQDPLHPVDTDGDDIPDYISKDNDGDGYLDIEEIFGLLTDGHLARKCGETWCEPGTPDNPWDSDGDTIPDYMDLDSDNDTIPDKDEIREDSDFDGVMNMYTNDSDGDGIPDGDEIDENGELLYHIDSDGNMRYCFTYSDCDGDGLADPDELICNGISGINVSDSDGDGFLDGAEYSAARYALENGLLNGDKPASLEDVVCNTKLGVTDVFEFYFELPYGGDLKHDSLLFEPSVQRVDLVFNVDTTESMSETISNVKNNIQNTITSIQSMVDDSGFGLTNFDDFPIGNYGVAASGDLPFRLLGTVSTDATTVQNYMNNPLFTTRHGNDVAESGIEALYQIATGAGGASWVDNSTTLGTIDAHTNATDTWGGVDFRKDTLPIIIHTTDAYSHDHNYMTYNQSVVNPHYSPEVIQALQSKGIRVITLSVPNKQNVHEADLYGQMTLWAKDSSAVVPACAFANTCGNNKCCLGAKVTDAEYINGKPNQCILSYQALQADVSSTIVSGVDALLKYGTYDVSTRISGLPIAGTDKDTSCFIKQVIATSYIPPSQEPEKSCNPEAVPTKVGDSDYFNGFTNFAPGTSSLTRKGATLHFTVKAQNDNCVQQTSESQVFTAYIDVYNPTTGLSFGKRKVSIIVPAAENQSIN